MVNTARKIRAGFGIALVFSLSAVALSYRTTKKLIDSNHLLAGTNGTLTALVGTVTALDNLERSRSSWVNAGVAMHNLRSRRFRQLSCRTCHSLGTEAVEAERFRKAHLQMAADLTRHTQVLRGQLAFEPAEREKLTTLEPLIRKKVALAIAEVELRAISASSETEPALLDQDVRLTEKIRNLVGQMQETERRLLGQRLEKRESRARSAIIAIGLLGLLTICVSGVAYVVIRRDLARQNALEEQLRQTAKMEAVGRLAGGVAHDFNNLLTPILSYAELLESELGAGHPLKEYVNEITKAGHVAASVTRQLLAFARRQALQREKLNVNAIATNTGNLLQRLLGDQHRLEIALEPALGWVEADRSQIEQVIMNLVLNARDAMPLGGTIALATANAILGGEKTCWCGVPLRGPYVVLVVSDNGPGLDEATRSAIFEPFFTTKQGGKGTGLGLATVYGIVTQSRGSIRVESGPGGGTTFEIYLPRTEPPPFSALPASIATGVPGARGVILLVEDDAAVRQVTHKALVQAGYEVIEACDGQEGWLGAQSFQGRIDLLASDITMPEMNGLELRRKLLAVRPGLRTIFVSGYPAAVGLRGFESVLDSTTVLLPKPFTPAQFLEKVGQLLGDQHQVG